MTKYNSSGIFKVAKNEELNNSNCEFECINPKTELHNLNHTKLEKSNKVKMRISKQTYLQELNKFEKIDSLMYVPFVPRISFRSKV